MVIMLAKKQETTLITLSNFEYKLIDIKIMFRLSLTLVGLSAISTSDMD